MSALLRRSGEGDHIGGGHIRNCMVPALQIESISKTFGRHAALRDVSIKIETDEIVALLGPSGCGKTTTLRIVAGFVAPTSGHVRMRGLDVRGVAPNRRNVGVVFQDFALFPHLSILENVAFGPRHRGVTKAKAHERARELLRVVRLDDFENRLPQTLSGGQQQRVALARAIATSPDILLLDEPLSALDAKLRIELRQDIKAILRTVRTSTIIVTHDQEEAMSMADRVLVMNDGQILQDGSPEDLYRRPQNPFVADFVGRTNWIEGRVEKSTNGRVFVSSDQMRFPVAGSIAEGAARAMIRPEAIRITHVPAPERTGLVWQPATVTDQSFLGQDIELHVRTDSGGHFLVLAREIESVGSQRVFIGIDPDHLIVFNKASA